MDVDPVAALLDYQKREDISQAELARRLGVSTASVSLWLRKLSTPDPESAATIERVTGIPLRSWYGTHSKKASTRTRRAVATRGRLPRRGRSAPLSA